MSIRVLHGLDGSTCGEKSLGRCRPLDLLRRDIEAIERGLDRQWPLWRNLDDVRRDVILSMAFNLGVAGFMKFKNTRRYLIEGRYEAASQEMLRSRWANQVGRRAEKLSKMMANGRRDA